MTRQEVLQGARATSALRTRAIIDDMLWAWVRHNIEEVGQLEYLLPGLTSSPVAEPAHR